MLTDTLRQTNLLNLTVKQGAIQIVACVFHYDKILVINELRLENVLVMAYTSLYYSLITVVPKS